MEPNEAAQRVSPGRPKVGTVVNDRYELMEQIGAGGFATVYRALDRSIERDVAVKVLNLAVLSLPEDTVETVLARFHREAKLAARVKHPCVVQVFDFGIMDGTSEPFMVMELLEGHDLEDEIKDHGPLDPKRALPLFIDCLEALGEAHDLGIVHKDLKPSNLFLSADGKRRENLRIVDFGIAHIGEEQGSRLTQTGYVLGTPQYMAPEYLHDQSISPALDVYQMGLILVETLQGKAVVDNQNPWTCALMHVSRDLSVPAALMDSPLGPIIDRALAFAPADRYPNAGAFAEALAQIDPATVPKIDASSTFRKISAPSSENIAPSQQTGEVTAAAGTGPNPTEEQDRISQVFTQTLEQYSSLTQISKAGALQQGPSRAMAPTAPTGPHALAAEPKDEAPKKKGALLIALAALILVGLFAIGFIVQSLSQSPDNDDDLALTAQATVAIPVIEAPPAEPEPEPVPEAAPDPVDVRIQSNPSGASVWLAGEELGATPLVIKLPVDKGEILDFVLRREDYDEARLSLDPHDNPEATVELVAIARPAAVVAPPKTAPPKTTATPRPQPKRPDAPKSPPSAPEMILAP